MVKVGDASVKGFHIQYDGEDHHVKTIEIAVREINITGTAVKFMVDFLLADSGGGDHFSGWVDVLVTADLE